MICYYKYDKYIITIEIDTPIIENVNEYKKMYCDKFKVLHIKDILNDTYTEINKYKINNEYVEKVIFFLKEELAFNYLFFLKSQYKLFPNGYSNIYREYYDDGNLRLEFFHTNGLINGKYTEYFSNKLIKIECQYVDGIINGEYKEFFNNFIINLNNLNNLDDLANHSVHKLKYHYNFLMGKKHGMNITYDKNGEILKKIYYEEDIKNGYESSQDNSKRKNVSSTNFFGNYYEKDLDNKKIIECNYKNDLLDGDYCEKDFNNNVIVKCKYDSGKIIEIVKII